MHDYYYMIYLAEKRRQAIEADQRRNQRIRQFIQNIMVRLWRTLELSRSNQPYELGAKHLAATN